MRLQLHTSASIQPKFAGQPTSKGWVATSDPLPPLGKKTTTMDPLLCQSCWRKRVASLILRRDRSRPAGGLDLASSLVAGRTSLDGFSNGSASLFPEFVVVDFHLRSKNDGLNSRLDPPISWKPLEARSRLYRRKDLFCSVFQNLSKSTRLARAQHFQTP